MKIKKALNNFKFIQMNYFSEETVSGVQDYKYIFSEFKLEIH